ncbi:MAG: cytochrome c-type biogenesis protein [Granulosicoccus sp.]
MKTLALLLLASWSLLAGGTHAAEVVLKFDTPAREALYRELLTEYRCLKCQNQNLASSNAGLADDLRQEIYIKVQAGDLQPAIDEYLVSRYGEFVLYRPRFNAVTALLWIGPFLLLALAIAAAVMYSRRNAAAVVKTDADHLEHARRLLDE